MKSIILIAIIFASLLTSCGKKEMMPQVTAFEGVETESGLKYQIIQEGNGQQPKASDNVTVHYKGWLTNGTVFDSSYKRGEPATFPLNQVITGWTEGVQLMKVGAKYRFLIPSHLAYGKRGAGHAVPPNSTLVFDIELIDIK